VDDAFEVPLAFLMNPENHQIHSKGFRGMERSYYAMPFASVTSGRAAASCACSMSDLSRMIRPVLTEVGIFLIPSRLCGVLGSQPAPAYWRNLPAGAPGRQAGARARCCWSWSVSSCWRIFPARSPNFDLRSRHIENGKLVPEVEK